MANYSDAYGTVKIYGNAPLDIVDLLYLQYVANQRADYTTNIELSDTTPYWLLNIKNANDVAKYVLNKIKPNHHNPKKYKYVVKLPFTGLGRWAFQNNVEWFFEEALFRNETDAVNSTVQYLQDQSFAVVFDTYDCEAGSNFCGHYQHQTFYPPRSARPIKTETKVIREDAYLSRALVKAGFYQQGELIDHDFILTDNGIMRDIKTYIEHYAEYSQLKNHIKQQNVTVEDYVTSYIKAQPFNTIYSFIHDFLIEMQNDLEQSGDVKWLVSTYNPTSQNQSSL